ncbi:prepilin peptidase [Candidatus Saccharibacteria bacterium]|nr:prepilin peptidase [Candidatus Saccharibacteria bacterium]
MDVMIRISITIACFIIGAILGSFACCQAWRLHLKEQGKKSPGKWSVCMSCGRRLKANENIPVISWLVQKGKCKSCGAKIGSAELLSEIGLGSSLAFIGWFLYPTFIDALVNLTVANCVIYPLSVIAFLTALVLLWTLLVYDAKWQKLPVNLLTATNIFALLLVFLKIAWMLFNHTAGADLVQYLVDLVVAVTILAGIYLALYLISRERLVGSGDWLIALPIALILGSPWLAIVTLFLSNFFASIYGLTKCAKDRKKPRRFQFAFGPFLVVAFIITFALSKILSQVISV